MKLVLLVLVYLPAHFLNSDGGHQLFEVQEDGTGDGCQGMGTGSPPDLNGTLSETVSVVSTHLDTGHELKASFLVLLLFPYFPLFVFNVLQSCASSLGILYKYLFCIIYVHLSFGLPI